MSALRRAHRTTLKDHVLIVGIDANTLFCIGKTATTAAHGVVQFRADSSAVGHPVLKSTCSARTSLEP